MPKYKPLADYLHTHRDDSCSLSFVDIERIIRRSLPSSARRYRSWWGNDQTHAQAKAWMQAGFRAEPAPLRTERVVFTRFLSETRTAAITPTQPGPSQVIVRNLDPDVVAALKRRAANAGRSLEKELRIVLTREARPNRRELIAEADRIRAMTPGPLPDSVVLLRHDRDRE